MSGLAAVGQDRGVELLADRLRVLGQPLRIHLLNRLYESPATVKELVEAVGGVQQNVSQHLSILHRAGIVSRVKDGTRVRYELAEPQVIVLLTDAYASLARQVDELARLIEEPRDSYRRGPRSPDYRGEWQR